MSESVEHLTQIEQAPKRGKRHMSESVELFTQIHQAPKTGNCHMSESVEHLAQIDGAETQVTTSCRPADLRNGKIHWTVVQISIFKKMKHDAINDDENDDKDDGNDNHMKILELDGAFCEHVLQILDMTLAKPKFRNSADQFGLVGKMQSDPLEAPKKGHKTTRLALY